MEQPFFGFWIADLRRSEHAVCEPGFKSPALKTTFFFELMREKGLNPIWT
jgi:hypothetical protein